MQSKFTIDAAPRASRKIPRQRGAARHKPDRRIARRSERVSQLDGSLVAAVPLLLQVAAEAPSRNHGALDEPLSDLVPPSARELQCNSQTRKFKLHAKRLQLKLKLKE